MKPIIISEFIDAKFFFFYVESHSISVWAQKFEKMHRAILNCGLSDGFARSSLPKSIPLSQPKSRKPVRRFELPS